MRTKGKFAKKEQFITSNYKKVVAENQKFEIEDQM